MERILTKKPGVCVFGLVLFTVLVFLYMPKAKADEIPCVGVRDDDGYCSQFEGETLDQANERLRMESGIHALAEGGKNEVPVQSDGSCPAGYTLAVSQTVSQRSYCLRNDLVTPKTATLGTKPPEQPEKIECTGSSGWTGLWPKWLDSPIACGFYFLGDTILWLFAKLVFLAGILFDFSIQFGIFGIKNFMDTGSVKLVWGTVRDLANIVFIFALLWISIQTILGLDSAKKHLMSIIVAALLINFSFFFARVLIDASNILAVQFYSGIVGQNCSGAMNSWDNCVSDNLMRASRMQTIFALGKGNVPGVGGGGAPEINVTNVILVTVFGSIFYLITAFLLLKAAFMFIGRTVVLVLLTAISPIPFVANIVPKLKKYHDDWWDNMINQALVAPIMLFFLWIVVKIAPSINNSGGSLFGSSPNQVATNSSIANALTGGGSMDIVFGFFFLIGLLYFALKITSEYSGKVGSMAVGFGGSALGMLAGGLGGKLLRGTFGRAASGLASNETLQRWGAENKFGIGRLMHKTAIAGAEANYDIRSGIPLVGGIAGKVLKQADAQIDFGKSSGKGGFRAFEKASQAADVKYAKELKSPEAKQAFTTDLENMNMLERFITARTKKSVTGTQKAVNEQTKTESRQKADEERLNRLNKEYYEGVKTRTGENLEDLISKGMAKEAAGLEERYEELLGKDLAGLRGDLENARVRGNAEDVGKYTTAVQELNNTMNKWSERERLERTVETRKNRQETATRAEKPSGGEGGGGAKSEDKK